MNESELNDLARLCRQFGAQPPQDFLMARKLRDRAEQMAQTRGMDKVAALQYLLTLMKNAREGITPPDAASLKGSNSMEKPKKNDPASENN